MKITYSSTKLEKILSNLRLLKKYYSTDYDHLRNRLSELEAASSLADISSSPPPRRHKLYGDRAGMWGIDYSRNDRIVLKPAGNYNIEDLASIVEIEIVALEDYH